MVKLYIVATPIGHLDDITLRALNTLKAVDYIACEDTRHTGRLLKHYEIKKPLLACHAHNERSSASGLIKLLDEGNSIAYCSDAGTPSLSDPGGRLVQSVVSAGYRVEPIPGVSAFSTLISVGALLEESFLFCGFLPQKGLKRERRLDDLLGIASALVIYESPYRMENLLYLLSTKASDRQIVVGREMTKLYEEFWRGTASEVFAAVKQKKIQGEFAILVSSA